MPIGGAIAAIGGGAISAFGANKAAKTQAAAAREAAAAQQNAAAQAQAFQREMFEKGQAGLKPYSDIGTSAFYSLAQLYGLQTPAMPDGTGGSPGGAPAATAGLDVFRASPEYQIPFQEGIKAIEYSRAAKGGLQNPNTSRELMQWGQGFAGSRLDSYIGQLLKIANIGQGAATAGAGQATAQGNALANTSLAGGNAAAQGILGAGQANAAGIVGMTNAATSTLQGASNNLALYSLLNPAKSTYNPATSYYGGPAIAAPAGYGDFTY